MKLTFTIFRKKSRYVIEQAMSKCYILIGIFQDIVEGSEGCMYMRIYFLYSLLYIYLSRPPTDVIIYVLKADRVVDSIQYAKAYIQYYIRIAFRSLSNWKNWTWHSSSLPSHFFCCNASHNFSFLFFTFCGFSIFSWFYLEIFFPTYSC